MGFQSLQSNNTRPNGFKRVVLVDVPHAYTLAGAQGLIGYNSNTPPPAGATNPLNFFFLANGYKFFTINIIFTAIGSLDLIVSNISFAGKTTDTIATITTTTAQSFEFGGVSGSTAGKVYDQIGLEYANASGVNTIRYCEVLCLA